VVACCGLQRAPEVLTPEDARARCRFISFDGIQGANLGRGRGSACAALSPPRRRQLIAEHARRAAELVVAALREGASERAACSPTCAASAPSTEATATRVDPPVCLRAAENGRWTEREL